MVGIQDNEYAFTMMAIREKWKTVITASLDLLFPPSCPSCKKMTGDNDRLLCRDCHSQLNFIKTPYCSCCGREFPGDGDNHLCGECLKSSWAFDKARSLFSYEDVIAELIHNLKYLGNMNGLQTIEWISRQSTLLQDFDSIDIILPVPLHIKRLQQRGFNQSLILARRIFANDRKKIRFNLLTRQADTPYQTGLSGAERRKNLRNAFSIQNPSDIAGRNTLLVDDVFTTGSTVNECAKVLKAAGAKRVDVLTICRADKFVS
jgi:ComF family protein